MIALARSGMQQVKSGLTGRSGLSFRLLSRQRGLAPGTQDFFQREERITAGIALNAPAQALVGIGMLPLGGLRQRTGPSPGVSASFLPFPGVQTGFCDELVK